MGKIGSGLSGLFDKGYDCRLGWCRTFCGKTNGGMKTQTSTETQLSDAGNDYAEEYGRANRRSRGARGAHLRQRKRKHEPVDYAETAVGDDSLEYLNHLEEPYNEYEEDYGPVYGRENGRSQRARERVRDLLDYAETAVGDSEEYLNDLEEPLYLYDKDDYDEEEVGGYYDYGLGPEMDAYYDLESEVGSSSSEDASPERPLSETDDMTLEEMIQDLLDSEQAIKRSMNTHRRATRRQRF